MPFERTPGGLAAPRAARALVGGGLVGLLGAAAPARGEAIAVRAGRWLEQLLGAAIPASTATAQAATPAPPRAGGEPAAVAPPTSTPVERPGRGPARGRGLVVAGVVALGLAAAAGGAAV